MHRSEVLAREIGSGELVDFDKGSIGLSSANAPWRDSIRVGEQSRAPGETERVALWESIVLCRRPGIWDQRVGSGPLQKIIAVPGDVYIYPPGVPIYARTAQPIEYIAIQIGPSVWSAVVGELGNPPKVTSFRIRRDTRIERIVTLFEAELHSGCSSGRLYGEYLGMALAAYVMQHNSEERSNALKHNGGLPSRTLNRTLEYIQAHAMRDIPLRELADVTDMSIFHFCRLFKKSTGFTPHQYVLHWRMEEAKRLLRSTNLNIAEISQRVGFADQSHFTAGFQKIAGTTPHRWRRAA
jgi:AraC family transcriptional regulator